MLTVAELWQILWEYSLILIYSAKNQTGFKTCFLRNKTKTMKHQDQAYVN